MWLECCLTVCRQSPKLWFWIFQQKKIKPTGCPRFDPLFGCCPWTMTSNEVEDCPVQVSFVLHFLSLGDLSGRKNSRPVCWPCSSVTRRHVAKFQQGSRQESISSNWRSEIRFWLKFFASNRQPFFVWFDNGMLMAFECSVLPGSENVLTEITEYLYWSLRLTLVNLKQCQFE